MDSLKRHILRGKIKSLLRKSSTFRDDLSKFLLNRNLNNLNYVDPLLFVGIKNEIFENTGKQSKELIKYLSHDLLEIFNQPDWLTLTRVIQIMKNLPTHVIDEQRLSSMYLKQLRFTNNYRIDLEKFSKKMCAKYDPEGIKVFIRLNAQQKNIIEVLNQQQIEALTNLRSKSINFLSKIMQISPHQRDIILSFNQAEIRMYRYMTHTKIHEILNYNPSDTNALLRANQRPFKELRMLYKFNPKLLSNIRKVVDLSPEKMDTLKNLLQHPSTRVLDREGITFLEGNDYIEDKGIREFQLKNDQQKHVIGNLDEELLNALVRFDAHDPRITLRSVLEQANRLGTEDKDMIVLLTTDQLLSILERDGAEDLFDIAHLTPGGRAYMEKLHYFPQREEHELFDKINQDQRRILSKLYVLLPDGLNIIRELGPEKTHETTSIRGDQQEMTDFNIQQKILFKRIQRLSVEERLEIFNLTLEEFASFNEIFQLGPDSTRYLMNLSREGLIVLNSVKNFNADQIQFVRDLSTHGISVLAKNGQLNPTTIESLRQLNARKSSFLIDLNQHQRYHLSTHRIEDCHVGFLFNEENIAILQSLTSPQEIELLSTISALTEQEVSQSVGIDDDVRRCIDGLDPAISRLFFPLEQQEIHRISDIFDWRLEERFAFGLWKSLLDSDPEERTINDFLDTLTRSILIDGYRGIYLKFITGVIMAYRSARPLESSIVEDIANGMDEIYEPPSKLEFYIYLLNYYVEDNVESSELERIFSKIPITEYSEGKLRELCDISHGNVPFLLRWMLGNRVEKYQDLFHRIIRRVLTEHVVNPNPTVLNALLVNYKGIRRSDVIESLRTELVYEHFLLTYCLFFNPHRNFEATESIAKWLSNILTPEQQFEFLNKPLNPVSVNSLDILEYSVFYDRGCPYPLFERLNSDQLRQLFEKNPVRLLRAIVRNGYFRSLQLFGEHVGAERLLEVMRGNHRRILLTDSGEFVFGNSRLKDLAQTIQWFVVKDPDPSFYFPIQTQLALRAKDESNQKFNEIIEILAPDQMDRAPILREVRRRRPPPDYDGPSCSKRMRYERSLGPACIDSEKKEDIGVEERKNLMRSLFENIETEHDDLYQLMSSAPNEANLKKMCEKIATINLDSVDSEIRDVLLDIKNVGHDKEKVTEILSKSNVATRIKDVAEITGFAFTAFLVGKHLIRGDLESLGFDAVNFWALPKLGTKVSEKLLAMGERFGLPAMRVIGPVLGRGIGNLGAFLGLAQSIRARKDAKNSLDIEIADINIITNSAFILADLPGLVTDILASFEIAAGTVGELAGPIGMSVSVGVIVLSESIQAALKLDDISKQIQLTRLEKFETFLKFWWDDELPDHIKRDLKSKSVYDHYITQIIHEYQHDYGMIGISLPSILVKLEKYCTAANLLKKYVYRHPCDINITMVGIDFDFSSDSVTTDPFEILRNDHTSRELPVNVLQDFHLVCGPKADDVETEMITDEGLVLESMAGDLSKQTGERILMDRITEKWFIPQKNNGDCDNMVLYKNQISKHSQKMLFHLSQNSSITISNAQSMDVYFWGRNISIIDQGIDHPSLEPPQSKYHFFQELDECTLHKEGLNSIFVNYGGNFSCNLGGESRRQTNVAFVQGNFTDIQNIHQIIGSDKSDRINVSYSAHVDGLGGNDEINVKNSTTVKTYYGDVIHGNTTIQLPMNVSDIHKILANEFITVYNRNNESVQVDAGSFIQTTDQFLIYPMKTDNQTHLVTHLYIHKNIDGDIVLEDELAVLELMETTQFNCSKQITSRNYDITLSDNNHSIFHADRNHHNFYWEADDGKNHLYIFEFITANITISKAKGVVDFSQFYHVYEDREENLVIREQNGAGMTIDIGGLHVNLKGNRQSIKITFDGENYYNIKNGRLERDYCVYSFKVDGRLIVDGQELFDHHNCFEFQSDKIIFYKEDRHLLLSSGRNLLTITNFYPLVQENLDVSLKLNSRVLGPKEFRAKASYPDPFRFYEIIEPGLMIYHNLPNDKDQIGVIYTNRTSILDHDIEFQGDNLLLTNRNRVSVTVVDWKKYQEAREVMFAFNDTLIFNAQCVSSTCTPEFILEEFQRQKQLVKSAAIRRKRNVRLDSPEIAGNSTYRFDNTFSAFKDNVNLVILFVQNFLDKKYPVPQFPSTNPEDVCAYATNIAQSFHKKLKETGLTYNIPLKDFDCYELYTNITEHLRNEEYSKASTMLNSVVREMIPQDIPYRN